ncbi:MAG: UDP-N-acetylmuramate--L-alanine ligase [Gemmatimonadales bacterium]|nr:UDP-N-acetylmuramate--L-alanine ligase [Gemmatimonadales bacterium]
MSALALLARRRGVHVTGCDTDPSGAADLQAHGVPVAAGHDASHVLGARALVVTAAVSPDHPELAAARAAGIPVVPRKEALGALCAGHETVAVSGTHGKTTTTVMTTEALASARLDPTGLAGGRVASWGGNARIGSDHLFVVEADEYDKAFLALQPTVAIVNNVEADHLECYGTVADLEAAFVDFASRARVALVGADDAGALRVARRLGSGTEVRCFGTGADADVRLTDIEQRPDGSRARVRIGARPVTLQLGVPGVHNLRNALAALLAADALGADLDLAAGALARFAGVGRRFERVGSAGDIEVVDDYAHHPTELHATLEAARQAFPNRRLVAVFQPHLYSRTIEHGAALGAALARADLAVVTEIYAARERPVAGVSGRAVADAAARAGGAVAFVAERDALARELATMVRPGDVVFTLGAGDITRVGPELLSRLGGG